MGTDPRTLTAHVKLTKARGLKVFTRRLKWAIWLIEGGLKSVAKTGGIVRVGKRKTEFPVGARIPLWVEVIVHTGETTRTVALGEVPPDVRDRLLRAKAERDRHA